MDGNGSTETDLGVEESELVDKELVSSLGISEEDETSWLETQPEELKEVGRRSFKNIRRIVDLFSSRLTHDHHLEEQKIKDKLLQEVARIKDGVFISVNMNSDRALRFAERGEYRSFLTFPEEKQTEVAARQNMNGDIEGYILRRKNAETNLRYGQLPEGAVSGSLASPNGRSEIRGGAQLFGDVFLVLDREKVASRVVYTMGDSMNSSAVENILGYGFVKSEEKSILDRQLIFEHAVVAESILNIFKPLVIQGSGLRYVEALIYGGFTINDVKEVRVPPKSELLKGCRDSNLYDRYARKVSKLKEAFGNKVKIGGEETDE